MCACVGFLEFVPARDQRLANRNLLKRKADDAEVVVVKASPASPAYSPGSPPCSLILPVFDPAGAMPDLDDSPDARIGYFFGKPFCCATMTCIGVGAGALIGIRFFYGRITFKGHTKGAA